MKKILFPIIVLGCLAHSSIAAPEGGTKSLSSKGKWVLVWSDEFDAPGKPDPEKWNIETEFVRNIKAKQLYTDREKNVIQDKGNLVLTAHAEKRKNGNFDPNSDSWLKNREFADYTSGSINSEGKVEFKYGKVEIKAKIEYGKGVWPALWMIGKNIPVMHWPKCGEIDILEYVSQDRDSVHGTFHWQEGNEIGFSKKYDVGNVLKGYHTYGMEWDSEKIDLIYDRKVFHTIKLEQADIGDYNAFRQPFYFILNLAIGGWAEDPDPKAYPRSFFIDYVRVYQRENDPEAELYIGGKKVEKKTDGKAEKK